MEFFFKFHQWCLKCLDNALHLPHSSINSFWIIEHHPTPKLQKSNICFFSKRGCGDTNRDGINVKHAQNRLAISNLFHFLLFFIVLILPKTEEKTSQ